MPPASPHNRKTGPSGEEEEEEDLVDKLIRNTGCEKEHYLVQVVELQPNHAHRHHQLRLTKDSSPRSAWWNIRTGESASKH